MTVKQFKDVVDYDELKSWQLFEDKYGLLHAPIRFEQAIARAVLPFLQNGKFEAFAPYPKDPQPEEGSIENVFALLKAAARSAKKGVKKAIRGRKKVKSSGKSKSGHTDT